MLQRIALFDVCVFVCACLFAVVSSCCGGVRGAYTFCWARTISVAAGVLVCAYLLLVCRCSAEAKNNDDDNVMCAICFGFPRARVLSYNFVGPASQ